MAIITNSSFKVKASTVETSVGIIPEKGALLFDENLNTHVLGNGTAWVPVLVEPYADTFFDDLLGPVTGTRVDSASTRYQFDLFNGTVSFDANARYPEEPLLFKYQLAHKWKLLSAGKPHLHWKQRSADVPNWLVGYFLDVNGDAGAIETDFTNYTFGVVASHAYTYTSGVLNQISVLPDFDLTGANISSLLRIVLFRDTTNVSTLFAGADPSALIEHVGDLDIHIEIDTPGSRQEYVK